VGIILPAESNLIMLESHEAVYYIRATIMEITALQKTPGMKLELIDRAEGPLLISSSALSTAHAKK
jgi:hypothetical protein